MVGGRRGSVVMDMVEIGYDGGGGMEEKMVVDGW